MKTKKKPNRLRALNIGIVTFEFEGLTKNGGIGTSFTRLAKQLAAEGHKLSVFFYPFDIGQKLIELKQQSHPEVLRLNRQGIDVYFPDQEGESISNNLVGFHLKRAWALFQQIKSFEFDAIHAPDNGGLLYYSLLAKKSGLFFQDCNFIIGSHGSTLWTSDAAQIFGADSILMSEMDRKCVEMADTLVSPSAYMIRYMKEKGWRLPQNSLVIPNINQLGSFGGQTRLSPISESKEPKTLVFFGRLEVRKGIVPFVTAVEQLLRQNNPKIPSLRLIFLGREERNPLSHLNYSQWIRQKLRPLGNRVELDFIQDMSSEESLNFLAKHPDYLVCMPSLLDNSPYVIVEAIERRINFLASNSGGQAELIHPDDHGQVLCAASVAGLTDSIERRLSMSPYVARPSSIARQANAQWSSFHLKLKSKPKPSKQKRSTSNLPKVSVFLKQHELDSNEGFARSLKSVIGQSYPNVEICIPESVSFWRTAIPKRFSVQTYSVSDGHSTWHQASNVATGALLLILEGKGFAEPTSLAEWVTAAENLKVGDAKCLATCCALENENPKFAGDTSVKGLRKRHLWASPANIPLYLLLGEVIQNDACLWNLDALSKLVRRLPDEMSTSMGATLLFSQAAAKGFNIEIIPKVLTTTWLEPEPINPENMCQAQAALRPLLETLPPQWHAMAYCLSGTQRNLMKLRAQTFSQRRQLQNLLDSQIQV